MFPHAISSVDHRLTALTRGTLNATEGDELDTDDKIVLMTSCTVALNFTAKSL